MTIEREKEQMERENKDLMLKLYQFKEQIKKSEKGEAWIVFTAAAVLCCGFWTCDIRTKSFMQTCIGSFTVDCRNAHHCGSTAPIIPQTKLNARKRK